MVDDAAALYRALPSPLLIGHRGLNTVAPENTLEAIAAAADLGVDGVEIDVRPTRDGVLVVFHDRDLSRLAQRPHRVEALDHRDLDGIDLGRGARIPRLEDVIDLCRERGLFLNVELKRDVPSRRLLVRAAAQCLKRHDRRVPLVVSSFDPSMLADFRRRAPAIPIGVLYESRHRWVRRLATPLKAAALHPDYRLVRPTDIRRAKAAGRRVMCWTVNSVQATRRLLEMGVDGIMTDDPEKMLPAFGRDPSRQSGQSTKT